MKKSSHGPVLHTFVERLRVDCVVCLSVLLCVGCTYGICVGIFGMKDLCDYSFRAVLRIIYEGCGLVSPGKTAGPKL